MRYTVAFAQIYDKPLAYSFFRSKYYMLASHWIPDLSYPEGIG